MSSQSTSAFFLSAFLHTFVVVALLLLSYCSFQKPEEPPHVFELVAGEGDNYAAKEAPALGVPEAPKVELPEIETPPAPKAPAKEPVIEPVPEPVPEPKVTIKPVPTPPKTEAKKTPTPTPKKAPEPKKAEQKMTKAEFDKLNPKKATTAPKTTAPTKIQTKKIDVAGITKGVTGGSSAVKSGAGGTALTRAEADLLDLYVALILQRIKESLESAGLSDLLEAKVEFRVSAAGAISGVRVVGSSGSREFDDAVVSAFRTIRPIGPPPTNRPEAFSVTVRMRER